MPVEKRRQPTGKKPKVQDAELPPVIPNDIKPAGSSDPTDIVPVTVSDPQSTEMDADRGPGVRETSENKEKEELNRSGNDVCVAADRRGAGGAGDGSGNGDVSGVVRVGHETGNGDTEDKKQGHLRGKRHSKRRVVKKVYIFNGGYGRSRSKRPGKRRRRGDDSDASADSLDSDPDSGPDSEAESEPDSDFNSEQGRDTGESAFESDSGSSQSEDSVVRRYAPRDGPRRKKKRGRASKSKETSKKKDNIEPKKNARASDSGDESEEQEPPPPKAVFKMPTFRFI